jgi:uncharacterized protein (DUF1684 family)
MKYLISTFILITSIAITNNTHAQTTVNYQKEIDDWHTKRINNLKADNGWLNLVGLYWLDDGKNSFGSSKQNKTVFPQGTIEDVAGYFVRSGNTVKLISNENSHIKINNQPVKEAVIFNDTIQTPVVSSGDLRWTIIKRGDKIGVRLRNLKSASVTNFKGVPRFAIDSSWKIAAILQPAGNGNIAITNILGQTSAQKSPGNLFFTYNGKKYSLDALEEGDELFIIFADSTSGSTTYPSGRFLSAKKPDAEGNTVIDFNKAYNPPCAFTEYATCPLPPKQNDLPFVVTAGEKYDGHH